MSARRPTTSPRCRSRPARRAARTRSSRTSPSRRAPCTRRCGDDRVAQHLEREDRLGRAALDRARRRPAAPAAPISAVSTWPLVHAYSRPAPDEPEQERRRPAGEQRRAEPVDRRARACTARLGIVSEITTSASPPTGRLTKKTQRQLALSTMKPPTAGPMIDEAAKTAPISPCHRPRSRGGTILPITASESGNRPPAPTPWTARKTTSCVIDWARPQSAEPTGRRRSRTGTAACGRTRRRASRTAAPSRSR